MTDLMNPAEETRLFWKSRTFWMAVITAGAPFVPGVAPLVAANPQLVASVIGAIFAALRVTGTHPPLAIRKTPQVVRSYDPSALPVGGVRQEEGAVATDIKPPIDLTN